MRDPKVLRTLIVLDLESHPPPAGIDVLTVTFEPVAGRIVQPSLLARAHPPPETIATLTARLRAVMGDGRVGSPVALDTHRGGAIGMRPFDGPAAGLPLAVAETPSTTERDAAGAGRLTLRRFRPPPPVRVELDRGRPVRVRSLEPRRLPRLGAVRQSAGPWRSSGDWWRPGAATEPPRRRRRSGSPIPRCGATSRRRRGTKTSGTSSSNRGPRCASRAIGDAIRWVVAALID